MRVVGERTAKEGQGWKMAGEKPVVEEELIRSDNVPLQNKICHGAKGLEIIIVRKEIPNAKAMNHAKRHVRL